MKPFFLIALVLVLAGCNSRSDLPPGTGASPGPLPPPLTQPAAQPGVDTSSGDIAKSADGLVCEAKPSTTTLRRGQTLTVAITVTNSGKTTKSLQFSSGQQFDLQARRVQNGVIAKEPAWTWSMDKMFIQSLSTVEIRPGQKLNFTATWDGTAGDPLPRGEYEISAFITANPRLTAPPFRITLA